MRLEAYLNLHGQAREALTFYQSILGGEIMALIAFGDMPGAAESADIPPEWTDKIMHGHLKVGETSIMACDYTPATDEATGGFQVCIQLDSAAEAQRLWDGLSAGAQAIRLPLGPTPWSPLYGMLTDKFGIPWMINTDMPGQQP